MVLKAEHGRGIMKCKCKVKEDGKKYRKDEHGRGIIKCKCKVKEDGKKYRKVKLTWNISKQKFF